MRVAILIVAATASALSLPDGSAGQTQLGVRGGVSLASFAGNDVVSVGSRTALNLGGFVTLNTSGLVGLQVGASFAQKGARETLEGIDLTVDLDYFEVPVLLTLSPAPLGRARFRVSLGPAVSIRTGCSLGGTGAFAVRIGCDGADAPLEVGRVDVGAMVGAGLTVEVTERALLVLDLLHDLGLSAVYDTGFGGDVMNRASSVLVGLAFPLR